MSKLKELIYSRQDGDFIQGRAYSNPRFFSTPRSDVSKVFIVGHYPNIREAYERLGVPVEQLDPSASVAQAAQAHPEGIVGAPLEQRAAVAIPEDWRDLKWTAPADQLSLRQLGALVSDTPVLKKADAIAAVEAELKRRRLDTPLEDAGGLTQRELEADLAGLEIDFDPAAPVAELFALRNQASEARAQGGGDGEAGQE